MASKKDNLFSTGVASEALGDTATPVKKAAAKRAPRKATKKASAPQQAPAVVTPVVTPEVTAEVTAFVTAGTDEAKAPARKAAKRAPRKSAKKAVAAPAEASATTDTAAPADVQPARAEVTPEGKSEGKPDKAASIPGFGLLFQAPEPTAVPRRRRATSPAAAPKPEPESDRQAPTDLTAKQGTDEKPGHAEQADDSDESGAEGARRRRRRGGKGRRGRGADEGGPDESSASDDTAAAAATAGEAEAKSSGQPSAEDDESGEGGASRRRTRRRRRGEDDDQPSTTTRVREPRAPRNEVTSLKGSTRLEAKKQRRREGREAGRRRTIITESEFLARRESVERVMVVRHKQDRTQIGVLEDGVLVEHYVSRETNASMAGNVYLGRIQNVLPSMEAAFVDIGKGRNAVLYAGEVNWDAAGMENNRAKKIENALSSGQGVLVQVTKDPIGHKGARLTSQVSLPGRYLVYVPDGNMMGISRKLPDTERARLKKILREIVPENAGVIVRTAAEGASEDELRADVTRLAAIWDEIQAKSKKANAPALLHGEPDLTVRVIRDVFNEDFASLVVSGDPAWETVNSYVNAVAPDLANRVKKWTGEQDLFTHYRVDEQIAKAMDRKVWLPSGGSLVIDRTEAMTVVDVNTGKFVGSGGNLEETVTKNNIEAAEEVVRQLRLRDIGGIIVIDFIDMVLESNRDLVVRRLLECLGRDRTKHQVAEVTSLGLIQMTRKRVGAGLIEVFSDTCEHCNGRGFIISADPIDRPAGDDGSSGGGGSGGKSGGADSGTGRGTRGRRTRGSGRDTDVPVTPEPKVTPGGPTPAQIAAAAHAAALHATLREEPEAQVASESDLPELPQDVPVEVEAPAKAPKSRRRASRSAKSPAGTVNPEAEQPTHLVDSELVQSVTEPPVIEPPVTEPPVSFEPPAKAEATPVAVDGALVADVLTDSQVPEVSDVPEVVASAPRGRRKRARVVAPAGPPRAG